MVHYPLPKCDPDDLKPLISALFMQASALEEISLGTRRKDLGFVTPRRREVQLKGYLADWRRRVHRDFEAVQDLSVEILDTVEAMEHARRKTG